jgi:hypothetical protein
MSIPIEPIRPLIFFLTAKVAILIEAVKLMIKKDVNSLVHQLVIISSLLCLLRMLLKRVAVL